MQPSFARDRRGSATKWFAYAAAAIVITAAVGAHGLAWIAQSGRVPTIAFLPLNQRTLQAQAGGAVDMDATGAIRTPARQP
ncbi:MAG TPA: hypothetical protein VH414_19110 [Lichenihabitans sp.]|jgi:hypothetical protein|nr:hypothetical protein [Lichenihabitans sp.]